MPYSWFKKSLITFALILSISACDNSGNAQPEIIEPYSYAVPEYLDDGWQVGHLADHGFNEPAIAQLIDRIKNKTHPGIDSISIVRNNTLLLHENLRDEFSIYDSWINNDDLNRHVMHSTSKSFVSALTGIAIQQGYIQTTQQPLLSFFDYQSYENWDERKNDITLEDALTMQLGLRWDEWTYPFGDLRNSLTAGTTDSDDFIKSMLDLPLVETPGEVYAYNTIATITIGAAVENVTGIPLEDYAEQFLFEPLQIDDAQWLMTPGGYPNTGSGLFLFTRDMAKFGQLYLDDGVWNGIRILESDWVSDSLAQSVDLAWDFTSGYGYQWWLGDFMDGNTAIPFYSTRGFGGQFIIIIPEYELVIAFTAHNYDNGEYDLPFRLVEQFILPAIES